MWYLVINKTTRRLSMFKKLREFFFGNSEETKLAAPVAPYKVEPMPTEVVEAEAKPVAAPAKKPAAKKAPAKKPASTGKTGGQRGRKPKAK